LSQPAEKVSTFEQEEDLSQPADDLSALSEELANFEELSQPAEEMAAAEEMEDEVFFLS
jgi:hypothetical protein